MYKGKPVITANRPFWRHPIFPWGWYSMTMDLILTRMKTVDSDGYYKPNDGGGGLFKWDSNKK